MDQKQGSKDDFRTVLCILGAVLCLLRPLWGYMLITRRGVEIAMFVILLSGVRFIRLLPFNSTIKLVATLSYLVLMGPVLIVLAFGGMCGIYHSCP